MSDRYWGKLEFPAALIDAEVTEALQEEGVEMANWTPRKAVMIMHGLRTAFSAWKIPQPDMAAGKTWKTS